MVRAFDCQPELRAACRCRQTAWAGHGVNNSRPSRNTIRHRAGLPYGSTQSGRRWTIAPREARAAGAPNALARLAETGTSKRGARSDAEGSDRLLGDDAIHQGARSRWSQSSRSGSTDIRPLETDRRVT